MKKGKKMSDKIQVYSKPNCVQCTATYKFLDRLNLEYEKIDITQDPVALKRITDMGFKQAPVVITLDDSWSGFRPDRMEKLAVK